MQGMEVSVKRPERWDEPFGPRMSRADVDRLLRIDPFRKIDPARFSPQLSLADILRYDSRVVQFEPGDVIVREGDYGHSAFLILRGRTRLMLESLPREWLGRPEPPRVNLWRVLYHALRGPRVPESRDLEDLQGNVPVTTRCDGVQTRVTLPDLSAVLQKYRSRPLGVGEMFGEVAAMTRTPREATVICEDQAALLELRWQGLRDILRRSPEFKRQLDDLYRQHALHDYLRSIPLIRGLSDADLHHLAQGTEFESYGEFEWNRPFRRLRQQPASERIAAEPLICDEGQFLDGVILIRSGFARLSQKYGNGHRTLAYLGKGHAFGWETLAANWHRGELRPAPAALRAVGYVDILRVPTEIVEERILPKLSRDSLRRLVHQADLLAQPISEAAAAEGQSAQRGLKTQFLEFILDHRLMNGTQAMIIDMDRCTRCDDCVRACAATHEGNPRFIRQGPQYDRFLFANACMHCADPVCMIGCPTGAIAREPTSGHLMINDKTCIGCATCAHRCPYQNIQMVEIRDPSGNFIVGNDNQLPIVKATKCDLCLGHWGGPACQRACPHDALIRIDMSDLPRLAHWVQQHQ